MNIAFDFTPLFYPKTVAVVGASANTMKWGFGIVHNILQGGFKGKVYPVNPRGGEVLGLKMYKSLMEIPENVDFAAIALPKEKVFGALIECAKKGVKAVSVIAAGFSETGEKEAEEEVAQICSEHNMVLVGPNGQGILSNSVGLHALMTPLHPPKGKVSMIAQSGNIGDSFMGAGEIYNLGFNKFVSSGNEALCKTVDFLEYLGKDPETGMILLYTEGVKDGRRFVDVAKEVSKRKPIICLKGGVTRAGSSAAFSHTGALAGSEKVFEGICRQAGILLVERFEEVIDLAISLAYQPLPKSNRVFAIAAGGGWGVIAADACEKEGLELVPLSHKLEEELKSILPPWWSPNNPIDLVAGRGEEFFEKVLQTLLNSGEADVILVLGAGYIWEIASSIKESLFYTPALDPIIENLRKRAFQIVDWMEKLIRNHKKPIITSSDALIFAYETGNQSIFRMIQKGLFVYPSPDRAAKVISRMSWYAQYLKRRGVNPPEPFMWE
jgi:acyl-CoA synthetase (NDP forming)